MAENSYIKCLNYFYIQSILYQNFIFHRYILQIIKCRWKFKFLKMNDMLLAQTNA